MAWQSRESLARAVDKLAAGAAGSPSRRRRWMDVVGSYWQRYCSKNDTIGFFGPLAWGSFASRARRSPCARARSSASASCTSRRGRWRRWRPPPASPRRCRWARSPSARCARSAGTPGLDRLEAARDAVAAARGEDVAAALDQLDRVFEEITGRPAARAEGDSGGGRTVAYLDCMRDLDVTLGPAVLDELRSLAAAGAVRVALVVRPRVRPRRRAARRHRRTGAPARSRRCSAQLMGAGFGLWDQMGEEQRELQRRWAARPTPSPTGRRRGTARGYHSADLQIAAASTDAVARGDFLVVLGDFHGGDNPLAQGLFGLRHPDPAAMMRRIAAETGPGVHLSPPRRGVVEMTARSWPLYPEGDARRDERRRAGAGAAPAASRSRTCVVEDGHVTDRAGSFRVPLAQFLYLPIFVAALRSFDPVGEGSGRAQIGRLVVRRAQLVGARRRAPGHAGRPRRLGARPRPPAPRLRPLAARAQAPLRRLREPVAAAARSRASSRPRASRRRARRSSSRRCSPARTSAGSRATPATTRASCASSRSTATARA